MAELLFLIEIKVKLLLNKDNLMTINQFLAINDPINVVINNSLYNIAITSLLLITCSLIVKFFLVTGKKKADKQLC